MLGARSLRRVTVVMLATGWIGVAVPAWSFQCVATLTANDVVRMGQTEVNIDGRVIDLLEGMEAGSTEGSVVLLRSPSETHRLEIVPASRPLAVRLYRHETLVSTWQLPINQPAHEYLLDDGTYVAVSWSECGLRSAQQTFVVMMSVGAELWRRTASELLPEQYVRQLTARQYVRPPTTSESGVVSAVRGMPVRLWIRELRMEGSSVWDARLVAHMHNDDVIEIVLHDATIRFAESDGPVDGESRFAESGSESTSDAD